MTSREIQKILSEASNKKTTCGKIKYDNKLEVHRSTIWRTIKNSSFIKYSKLKKKPLLTKKHKIERLNCARSWMSWEKEWYKIVFSDEKKFNLDGADGYQYYYHDIRKEKQYSTKRQGGGGSIMTWGAVGYKGTFDLVTIDSTLKAVDYIELLSNNLLDQAKKKSGYVFIFQHDNAPIHNSLLCKKFLSNNNIETLHWPSRSPDLNIMENLWGILVRSVYENGRQFSSKEELKNAILFSWANINKKDIKSMYDSMPNRIFEVIKNNGGTTKY